MRRHFAVAAMAFLVCSFSAYAQTGQSKPLQGSESTRSTAKIDPAKEADIRQLMEMIGTAALAQQMMDRTQESIKPLVANSLPPGDYRGTLIDLFFEKFRAKFTEKQIIDMAVVHYDQNFSDEEIKGLIEFYRTPLGQKLTRVLPSMTAEMQKDGQALGQKAGRDAMIEVLAEHPDLAQAMQQAAQSGASNAH